MQCLFASGHELETELGESPRARSGHMSSCLRARMYASCPEVGNGTIIHVCVIVIFARVVVEFTFFRIRRLRARLAHSSTVDDARCVSCAPV